MVLKTARYDDAKETVEFAELQLFVGPNYVVTVRHGEASALTDVRRAIEADMERLRCGPMAVLHAVIDRVVDDYMPVIDGLDNDMAEVEATVFTQQRARGDDPTRRIFKLKREVLSFHRNSEPLLEPLARLASGTLPGAREELTTYFRDVEDHLHREVSALGLLRDLLSDALDANLAQVTVQQNDDMRTISAWLAIGGFPTVVGAIYGMNFEHMPELGWEYGYYVVLVVMALCARSSTAGSSGSAGSSRSSVPAGLTGSSSSSSGRASAPPVITRRATARPTPSASTTVARSRA